MQQQTLADHADGMREYTYTSEEVLYNKQFIWYLFEI